MELLFYVIAVSLQVSGAVILLVKYCFKAEKSQLEENQMKKTRVEGDTLYLGENVLSDKELLKEVWLSRFAFLFISVGYIVGIFGDVSCQNKFITMCEIVLVTIIIVVITIWVTSKIVLSRSKK